MPLKINQTWATTTNVCNPVTKMGLYKAIIRLLSIIKTFITAQSVRNNKALILCLSHLNPKRLNVWIHAVLKCTEYKILDIVYLTAN